MPNRTLVFSKGETLQFFAALEVAFRSMPKVQVEDAYQYVKNRNAIAISYDAESHPFLDFTAGYDDQDYGVSIPGDSHILSEVRSHLRTQPYDIPGGRVLLGNGRAYRLANSDTVIVCQWTWLGEPIIASVLLMLEGILSDYT